MKKLFFTLIAVFATSLASLAQITLSDAYTSLAQLPGMSAKSTSTVQIDGSATINNAKTVSVSTNNVGAMRNQFFYMIESLPLRNQLIGANNQRELASVFAEPAGNGMYNVLVMKGNALTGTFTATYGQTNKAGIDAISNCELTMDSDELVLTPTASSPGDFISMTR